MTETYSLGYGSFDRNDENYIWLAYSDLILDVDTLQDIWLQ